MRRHRLVQLVMLLALMIDPAVASAAASYTLGPQDILKIRVFEWRPSAGVAYEWVPLTGEFTVSADGRLSLPIVGSIIASGKTPDQVSDIIGERLQQEIGLQKRPKASIEVSSYRPFFVTGAVATPGKYNYLPGLTVMQALSMAGGTGTLDPKIMDLQREALVNQGAARELDAERGSLLARKARIDATMASTTKIAFPSELTSQPNQVGIAQIMGNEQALLDSRMKSLEAELSALQQSKILSKNQLDALRLKDASLTRQIELANKDVSSVNKLVAQGLTVSSRQMGATQNLADLEGRSLDVSLAILTTQQDLAKVDQDALSVVEKYKVAALSEATDVRDRLAANDEKNRTARALQRNIEMRVPIALSVMDADGRPRTITRINRVVDGAAKIYVVGDNDPVLPGDVIRVEPQEQKSNTSPQLGSQ